MPDLRFILLACRNCQAEYRVRLERVEAGQPVECLTCGYGLDVTRYAHLAKLARQASALILEIEHSAKLDGEVIRPRD